MISISSSAADENEEESEAMAIPYFMIHPKSNAMFRIKMMRLCMKSYIAIIIPFRIPFEEKPHILWLS